VQKLTLIYWLNLWIPMHKFKLPGESNPDFARAVVDYISQFDSSIVVSNRHIDRMELYQWCSDHLGSKYQDWFVYEGGTYEKTWNIYIRSARRATMFRLRWADAILDSVDLDR
jgi:hypothetical protein